MKEMEKIIENLKNKFKNHIEHFKNNPIEFFEEYYELELYDYQKIILKMLLDKENKDKKIYINYPKRNGRTQMREMIYLIQEARKEEEKDMRERLLQQNVGITTITIVRDGDGKTPKADVFITNINGLGQDVKIPRAEVSILAEQEDLYGRQKNKFIIEIKCPMEKGQVSYMTYDKNLIGFLTDKELIAELKKRNVLVEETFYKCKKVE
jgi:hypothetical protein